MKNLASHLFISTAALSFMADAGGAGNAAPVMPGQEPGRPAPELVSKLRPLDLGHPMAFLADEKINQATAGIIVGRATALKESDKKDEATGAVIATLRGFKGSFRAIPLDVKKPVKASSVLYLPEGLVGSLLDRLTEAKKDGELISIDIAMEMFVQRAKHASGYEWGGRSLLPNDGVNDDPAADVMRAAGLLPAKAAAPAITDGTGGQEQPPLEKAPEGDKAPAGKKGK